MPIVAESVVNYETVPVVEKSDGEPSVYSEEFVEVPNPHYDVRVDILF